MKGDKRRYVRGENLRWMKGGGERGAGVQHRKGGKATIEKKRKW